MATNAESGARKSPAEPQQSPTRAPAKSPTSGTLKWDGRSWPLQLEAAGWRLRSKAKGREANFRTGTTRLDLAKQRAREWLEKRAADPVTSRRGGGNLEALAAVYTATPKRCGKRGADTNISRMRTVCRVALGKELPVVTCREVGPELWQKYQKAALEAAGHKFDLSTRRRENIPINACVRAARSLFIDALLTAYRADGLDARPDAAKVSWLPEPYVAPSKEDDAELVKAWGKLAAGSPMWVAIGLARFAGLRRDEIGAARSSWIMHRGSAVSMILMDRPEDEWQTKTGRPTEAHVINGRLASWLSDQTWNEGLLIPDPVGLSRGRWFERHPQAWLGDQGVDPLHAPGDH